MQYVKQQSICESQAEQEAKILERFRQQDYSFDRPLVIVNPYLINPLSALILFHDENETEISYTVKGKTEDVSISHTFPEDTEHIIPVIGLYPETDNQVTLATGDGRSITLTVTTGAINGTGKKPCLRKMNLAEGYRPSQLMFYFSALREMPMALDANGDVRWLINRPMQWGMIPLRNGHFMIGTDRYVAQPYYTTGMYELDLCGRIYAEYKLPGGLHHDFVEMENGDLLIASDDFSSGWAEDYLVLMERKTGKILREWDLKDILSPYEGKSNKWLPNDWFHMNAVWYDKKGNQLLLSGRHIDGILSLDYETGKINWILGDPEGWPEDKQKYFFTPIGEDFTWQYCQHDCTMAENGDILCFDNGCGRSKIPEKCILNRDNFSRGVRYHIDTEKMTIEQIWEFGREYGGENFCSYISNARCTGDEKYLIHFGGIGYENGETWEKAYVPVLIENDETLPVARTYEVDNGNILSFTEVRGNYYRAYRMDLYTENYSFTLEPVTTVGSLGVTPADMQPNVSEQKNLDDRFSVSLTEESDRYTILSVVPRKSTLYIVLENEDQQKFYGVNTDPIPLVHLLSGMPLDSADVKGFRVIHKEGLSGCYRVKLYVDGILYDCNRNICC